MLVVLCEYISDARTYERYIYPNILPVWKGWKEEVERDLQVLGVRRWRAVVADRKK